MGDRIAQLLLERIETPTVQKVRVLSAIVRGKDGSRSTRFQSIAQSMNYLEKQQKGSNLIPSRSTNEDDVLEKNDGKCPNLVPQLGITQLSQQTSPKHGATRA